MINIILQNSIMNRENIDTANVLMNLAEIYKESGRPKEAKPLYKRIFEIYKKELGENHSDTAYILNQLALIYHYEYYGKKLEEAEAFYKKSFEIYKALGGKHPNTAIPLQGLAALCNDQGKKEEAIELYEKVFEINKEVLGEEHPDTIFISYILEELYEER